METELTIQQVAQQTRLSIDTLRYYERIGLLDPVGRAASGHRRYISEDLAWISFLQCLRATGMSIQQMQTYAELRRRGDTEVSGRLAFLEAHQQQVQANIHELEGYLAVIERKIQHHRNLLADERNDIAEAPASSHLSLTT